MPKRPSPASLKVLKLARDAAADRLIRFTDHAHDRMMQEHLSAWDVRDAIMTATHAEPGDGEEAWKLSGGVTDDGREVHVVVALAWNTLVVTVFSKEGRTK